MDVKVSKVGKLVYRLDRRAATGVNEVTSLANSTFTGRSLASGGDIKGILAS